jgi:hypothetical protein
MNCDLIQKAGDISFAREISPGTEKNAALFSVCTLMTQVDEYQEMIRSFLSAGFTPEICEFLYVNNTAQNQFDAFTGLNLLMQMAQGKYVILCHQDIRLDFDRREVLEIRIAELNRVVPQWAVFGNVGVDETGGCHAHISHPSPVKLDGHPLAEKFQTGGLPARCESLDENFLVVKRAAGLRLSADLTGFHFYGTDICRVAKAMGYSAWAVDFHLLHKSRGKVDERFILAAQNMESKLKKSRGPEYLQTICARLYFGRCSFRNWFNGYRRLYYVKKNGGKIRIGQFFLGPKFLLPVLWLLHKVSRPFENLVKSSRKRIG